MTKMFVSFIAMQAKEEPELSSAAICYFVGSPLQLKMRLLTTAGRDFNTDVVLHNQAKSDMYFILKSCLKER